MNFDYKKIMDIKREYDLNKREKNFSNLREFLHRFIDAADSHVELEPFTVEGEKLLRETDYDYDGVAAE